MTKILAFHLPQFHSIPENDKWWGKGFTEWVNVKKSLPLFEGHNQPRIPMDYNYYNMLDRETLMWQAELAKKYRIDGFCFYHYWFNGKLLLEKPLERLLVNKDIDLKYCFCWANEPWTRSWDGAEKEVIMPQEYGEDESWEKHLQYLMKFFKDERYIQIDDKPALVIYRTSSIPKCDEMIKYWDKRCKELGYKGIYIIEEVNSFQNQPTTNMSKACIEFEPMNTLSNDMGFLERIRGKLRQYLGSNKKVYIRSYDYVWKRIINRQTKFKDKKTFLGAFVDWDNTPRKKEKGVVFEGASPSKFRRFFEEQYKKAVNNNYEYIFINAWNEWAEGTYLEPDTKNGYSYLEAIKDIVDKYNN